MIDADDCGEPEDLSAVAATVRDKTAGQTEMVRRMDPEELRNAPANMGHHCAVALVLEGIVKSITTLNFDLSMSHALADVGARGRIAVVRSANEWEAAKSKSLIYLHQNINSDWEDLVLTAEDLDATWQDGWQRIVAVVAVATPLALFAGLGTPTTVLVESVRTVRASLPHSEVFLASPGPLAANRFAAELGVDDAHFIQLGWVELMRQLAARTMLEHKRNLERIHSQLTEANAWQPTSIEPLLDRLIALGIAALGKLRGMWVRQENDYLPMSDEQPSEAMVEILDAIAAFEDRTGSQMHVDSAGVLEFRRGNEILGRALCASGRGVLTESAVISAATGRMKYVASANPMPDIVLVTSTLPEAEPPSPPDDILHEPKFGSVLTADRPPRPVRLSDVRQDPNCLLEAWEGAA